MRKPTEDEIVCYTLVAGESPADLAEKVEDLIGNAHDFEMVGPPTVVLDGGRFYQAVLTLEAT